MESIRYLSLLILVALTSCITNASVVEQSEAGNNGVNADTKVEKTTTVTGEEVPPENSSDEITPIGAAPANNTEASTPANSVKKPPAAPVDKQESTNTNIGIYKDAAI